MSGVVLAAGGIPAACAASGRAPSRVPAAVCAFDSTVPVQACSAATRRFN